MYGLAGEVGLVTGAAQGIGQAVARRLAAEGMRLALADIQGDRVRAVARELGETHQALELDVSSPVDVRRAIPGLLKSLGRIDCLVNVAGVGRCADFLDLSFEEWRWTLDVNLHGTFLLCQQVGRHMAEQGGGRIVTVASIAGKSGSEILAAYSASKGGVILLTQSVGRALARFGVRVNAVCPGLVWTPMWRETATWMGEHNAAFGGRGLTPEQIFGAVVESMTPTRKPTSPEEVAAVIAFLLSPEASAITCQAINIDGGIEMH